MSSKITSQATMYILAILAAALIAAGCGSDSNGTTDTETVEQQIAIAIAEVLSLDPSLSEDVDSSNVITNIFSGLTRISGADNEVVPDLAESWEWNDDATEITFTLRSGLVWSNGEPLTAQDFVYGWTRTLDPKTGSALSYLMYPVIKGASAFAEGEIKANELGIEAVDDLTLKVTLEEPTPWVEYLMASPIFFPLPEATIEKFGDDWVDAGNIVTNGPFLLTEEVPEQSMTLTRNPDWWNVDAVMLETAELSVVKEPSTAYKQFLDGKFDASFTSVLPGANDVEDAKTREEFHAVASMSADYLWLNTTSPELTDPNVRRAIALGINRPQITEDILKGGEVPSATIAPEGIPGFDTIEKGAGGFILPTVGPDPDRARQFLEEAAWSEDNEITLHFSNDDSDTAQLVAESIKASLGEIGVNVKLVPYSDTNTLYDRSVPPIPDTIHMFLLGWTADYPDTLAFYELLECQSEFNSSNYCSEAYDGLVADARAEEDADTRYQLEAEIEALQTSEDGDFALVPLYRISETTMVQENVDGFDVTSVGTVDLSQVEMTG